MRNIADIIKDDRNGKHLSQTERQIAVAYIQGKYDAVLELSNLNTHEVLDKVMEEIMDTGAYEQETNGQTEFLKGINYCLGIIDKYLADGGEVK